MVICANTGWEWSVVKKVWCGNVEDEHDDGAASWEEDECAYSGQNHWH